MAGNSNSPDIRLLFGVQGDGTLAEGSSGKEIQKQLSHIVEEINRNPFQIRFTVDTRFLQDLREQLQAVQNGLNNLDQSTGGGGAGRIIRENTDQMTQALIRLESARAKVQSSLNKLESNRNISGMTGSGSPQDDLRVLAESIDDLESRLNSGQMRNTTFTSELNIIRLETEKATHAMQNLIETTKEKTGSQTIGRLGDDPLKAMSAIQQIVTAQATVDNLLAKATGLKDAPGMQQNIDNLTRMQTELVRMRNTARDLTPSEFGQSFKTITIGAKDASISINNLARQMKEQQANQNNIVVGSKEYTAALSEIDKLSESIAKTQNKYATNKSSKLTSDKNDLSEYAKRLDDLRSKLAAGAITQKQFNDNIKDLKSGVTSTTASMSNYGAVINTLKSQLSSVAGLVSMYYTTHQLITKGVNTIKDMVAQAKELDAAFADTRIVTHATAEELKSYSETISDVAQETATSINDLVSATTTYARLGYTLEESTLLAKYTGMLEKVGNIDTEKAENAVTAIIKAFPDDVDIETIESAMDKLVATGKECCPRTW